MRRYWAEDELRFLRDNYHLKGPQQLARELGRAESSLKSIGSKLGLKSPWQLRVESVRHDYFSEVTKPTQAYLLGLMASDGNVGDDCRVSIELLAKDRVLVELFRDEIAPRVLIAERVLHGTERASFCVSSKLIASDLATYGVTPRKTFTLRWPERLPPELAGSFICGVFDGDGTLGLAREMRSGNVYPRWEICSAAPGFLESVAEVIRRNTDARVPEPIRPRGRSTWTLRVNSANAVAVDRWIHAEVPGLSRKRIPAEVRDRPMRRSPRKREDIPPLPGKARGERSSKAKLTEAFVAEARARHRNGERIALMAVEYGVSRVALRNAVTGKTWKHVVEV